jgi:hypothetical protein
MKNILIALLISTIVLSTSCTKPKLKQGYVYQKVYKETEIRNNEALGVSEIIPGYYIIKYRHIDENDSILVDEIEVNQKVYNKINMGDLIYIDAINN